MRSWMRCGPINCHPSQRLCGGAPLMNPTLPSSLCFTKRGLPLNSLTLNPNQLEPHWSLACFLCIPVASKKPTLQTLTSTDSASCLFLKVSLLGSMLGSPSHSRKPYRLLLLVAFKSNYEEWPRLCGRSLCFCCWHRFGHRLQQSIHNQI
jgi:hypothetical protein